MDKEEAKTILSTELDNYKKLSYSDLLYLLDTQDTKEVQSFSGVIYQLEFQVIWDDKKGGNLRVMGAIDDGRLRSLFPLTNDFILSPDGSFV